MNKQFFRTSLTAILLASALFTSCDRAPAPATNVPPDSPRDVPGSPVPAPEAGDCGTTAVISDHGIGMLRIGLGVDSLKAQCRVTQDTVVPGPEGTTRRVLEVALDAGTVRAEINAERVWRLSVTSPRFLTANTLGAGVPLARLLEMPGVRGMNGEGGLYVAVSAHCGLSFRVTAPAELRAEWTLASLKALPETTVVEEVLVFGCQ